MITANIRFLTNSLIADLTCKTSELQSSLQNIGVLTPPLIILLDNARTLQIRLSANDEIGEAILGVVNLRSDTLGNVQRLCRYAYFMNDKEKAELINKISSGSIKTVTQGIKAAEKMREEKER